MLNPLISDKQKLLYYILFWTLVSGVHISFLINQFSFSREVAITDGLLYNYSFAILALGLWYVVKYSTWDEKDSFQVIINLSASAILIVGFWFGLNEFLLNQIFYENQAYIEFSKSFRFWRISFGLIYFFLVVLLYYVILYYSKLQEKRMNEIELKKSITEAKLNMIRNQINPHFLFNSLNSIASLTIDEGTKAREMIQRLSNFLRYSLSHQPNEMISIKEEIEVCSQYLEIEKVRFSNKFSFQINLQPDLEQLQIPNMILQPLIENAVKYGVQEAISKVEIQLIIQKQNDRLKLEVRNTIEDNSRPKKGVGFGHKHIKERLHLIYSDEASFHIEKNKKEFIALIDLPVLDN